MTITQLIMKVLRENQEGVHNNALLVYRVWKLQNARVITDLYDPATIIRIKQRLIKDGQTSTDSKGKEDAKY